MVITDHLLRCDILGNAVKTLAIRSTAEEVTMARRAESKGFGKSASNLNPGQKSLIDDFRIRSFIEVSLVPFSIVSSLVL